jgi:hypothetical protein
MARTPREEVIQQCYRDLEFAEEWLPEIDAVSSEADWGRVSKSAARALLVRIGLYEGTFVKYHGLNSDSKAHLKMAVDAAERIIQSGKHALYPDYQKLFYFDGEGRQNTQREEHGSRDEDDLAAGPHALYEGYDVNFVLFHRAS